MICDSEIIDLIKAVLDKWNTSDNKISKEESFDLIFDIIDNNYNEDSFFDVNILALCILIETIYGHQITPIDLIKFIENQEVK